jgi:hypothetical protein
MNPQHDTTELLYTVELLQFELQGKQKNIRVIENSSYRNTFFLLIFQLNLHQAHVLEQEKHGEDLPDFCLQNI